MARDIEHETVSGQVYPEKTMKERLTVDSALSKLAQAGGSEFTTLFLHGSLQVEIYKPKGIDRQQPHSRDEIYVVISGSGYFVQGSGRRPFTAGEVIFVPAGVVHRFEEFSDNFATWVFFYGPSGGENSIS